MDEFERAKVMLKKLRPIFDNPDWLTAFNLLKKIDKKSTIDIEGKKKQFIYIVDKLY